MTILIIIIILLLIYPDLPNVLVGLVIIVLVAIYTIADSFFGWLGGAIRRKL